MLTWDNPKLSAYLYKEHERAITTILSSKNMSRSKRKWPEPDPLSSGALALQGELNTIKLESWRHVLPDSALFMRSPKYSDRNQLLKIRQSASYEPFPPRQAVIKISIHNRVTWGPSYVSRVSQHSLLSCQTLADVVDVIPCVFKKYPPEVTREGHSTGTTKPDGCVMCVEGVVYGDKYGRANYADKLLSHLQTVSSGSAAYVKATSTLSETPLSSLTLRVGLPYWLLHQGNCEHFVVIDQIRLQHSSDPQTGYPLTLQLTPSLLDMCRACSKVPAVWAISGDIRLGGDSPCVLCGPCWKGIGDSTDENVTVKPLPCG
ncbi:snRNA-activating protein of 50kDa MW C terminal-domain-containing protein [Infundibulicybe gibba]|nr:snRNA-activating protein of 50kDa MW C terminal-domain-containing protein [Infundibulicybe gibba]